MKKIFLICLSAVFISTGFAQSSVSDVPENKIKPAYEVAQPAKKTELQQKQLPKNTEQVAVIITDKNSSINKATPQTVDKTWSVMDTPAAKPAVKKADNNGSVAPKTKKEAVKPVDNSSSVEDVPPVKKEN